jgi:hypothetical protein
MTPMTDLEKAAVEALTNLYAGVNFAASKTSFVNLFTSLGLETSQLEPFFSSIAALSTILATNPTAEALNQTLLAYRIASEAVVNSQPGLGNLRTDSDVINDVNNQEFFQLLAKLDGEARAQNSSSNLVLSLISNKNVLEYARILIMMKEVSNRAVATKLLSSKYSIVT